MAIPFSPSLLSPHNFSSLPFPNARFAFSSVQRLPGRISHKFNRILAVKDHAHEPMELMDGCNYCPDLKTWMEIGMKQFENAFTVIILFLQLTSPIPLTEHDSWLIPPAEAVLYSPETKIPRTGELALRRAIPANKDMKAIQDSLEELSYLLRIPQRKPFGTMEGNVKKALKTAVDEKESILSSMPAESRDNGSILYASLTEGEVI